MNYQKQQQSQRSMREQKKIARIQSSRVGETRKLDNHFDGNVHNKAWFPWKGPDPRYDYSDSGLGIYDLQNLTPQNTKTQYLMKYQKLQQVQELIDKNRNVTNDEQNPRKFREYEHLKENDIIVTIEYCTNCKQHQISTRHDEKKYFELAQKVKNEIIRHFPVVKVYLKPLQMDPDDKSITQMYLQRRLGAFEIQVCSKLNGKFRLETVFSKIKNKKWPNLNQDVLNQIPKYMNHQSLIIQFVVQDNDDEMVDYKAREEAFKRLKVHLKTIRQNTVNRSMLDNSYQVDNTITNFQIYNKSRPVSGVPNNQFKNSKTNQSQNRTFLSINKKINDASCIENNNTMQIVSADSQGRVYFNNIPEDNYVIEVYETNDFKSLSVQIRMFEMIKENMPFHKKVLIEKQKLAFLSITLSYENVFVSEAEVELKLANNEGNEEEEIVEIQESPPRSGKYTIQVEPNNYILSVRRKQFENYDQYIDLKAGTNELAIVLKNIDPNCRNRLVSDTDREVVMKVISVYNALTKMPIQGAQLAISNKETFQEYIYNTNAEGIAEIEIKLDQDYELVISKQRYLEVADKDIFRMDSQNEVVSFPMIERSDNNQKIRMYLSTNFDQPMVSMNVVFPDDQIEDDIQDSDVIKLVNEYQSGYCYLEVDQTICQENYSFIRVVCQIMNTEIFNSQNLKLFLIIDNQIQMIQLPKSFNPKFKLAQFWDIGFINPLQKTFIETNGLSNTRLNNRSHMVTYQKLFDFMQQSKNLKLRDFFGFNHKSAIETSDDILVKQEVCCESMKKYGFEIMKKEEIEHIIASAAVNEQLYISYKRLNEKFERLQNVQFIDPDQHADINLDYNEIDDNEEDQQI